MKIIKHFAGDRFLSSKNFFREKRCIFVKDNPDNETEIVSGKKIDENEKSDVFGEKHNFDILEGLEPQTKSKENLTYGDYLKKSLSEIKGVSSTFSVLSGYGPKELQNALQLRLEGISSEDGGEYKELMELLESDEYKGKINLKALIEKNQDEGIESGKDMLNKTLKTHTSELSRNLNKFSENIEKSQIEKHTKLKSQLGNSSSPTLDLMDSKFKKEFGIFSEKINYLEERFGPEGIGRMYSSGEYNSEYSKNLIYSIRKDANMPEKEYSSCFNADGTINQSNIFNVIEKYFSSDTENLNFFTKEKQAQIKMSASNKALEKVNERYFKKFNKDFSKSESALDTIIYEYDEYLKLSENPKNIGDCEELIKSLPIEQDKISNLLSLMRNSSKDFIKRFRELSGISDKDYGYIVNELYGKNGSITKMKNDPLFWTAIYSELLSLSEHFYQKLGIQEVNDGSGISLDELNGKSIEDCDNAFTSILGGRDKEGNSTIGLLDSVSKELEEKKSGIDSESYNYLNNELYGIQETSNISNKLNERLKKSYENSSSEKEKENILKRIRLNSRVAFDFEKNLKEYKKQLNGVEGGEGELKLTMYSLSDVFNVYKSITTFYNEKREAKSKLNGHELAAQVTRPFNEQLSNEQEAQADVAYDAQVTKWKETFKGFGLEALNKRLEYAGENKVDCDELEAIISMLSEKGMLQYDNEDFLKALNQQLYSGKQIDADEFYKLDFTDKQKKLKTVFKEIFHGSSTIFQEIDDQNTKTFTETANGKATEITKMANKIGEREFEIYSDYMKLADEQGVIDSSGQIKKGKIVQYDEDTNIDPMLLEEGIFNAIKEAASSDINTMMYYMIRGFSSGLLPAERLAQIEERGTYGVFGQMHYFRQMPIERMRELDRELTDNGRYKDLNPESPFMRERIVQFMEKIKNESNAHDRIIKIVNKADAIDPDLWQTMGSHIDYSVLEKSILAKKSGAARIDDIGWGNFISSYSTHLYHFGKDKDGNSIEVDDMSGNSVKYMIGAMKSFLAVDSVKVLGTYKGPSSSGDYGKLDPERLKETPGMGAGETTIGQHAGSVRDILQYSLGQMGEKGKKVLSEIYETHNSANYFDGGQGRFSVDFDSLLQNDNNKKILIDTIKMYQDGNKIPAYYKNANSPIDESQYFVDVPKEPENTQSS